MGDALSQSFDYVYIWVPPYPRPPGFLHCVNFTISRCFVCVLLFFVVILITRSVIVIISISIIIIIIIRISNSNSNSNKKTKENL